MDWPWTVHEQSLDCPLTVHRLSIDCPWTVHGQSLDCPWTVHGLSTGSPWTVNGQSMDCPWTVHGQSMDSPCGGAWPANQFKVQWFVARVPEPVQGSRFAARTANLETLVPVATPRGELRQHGDGGAGDGAASGATVSQMMRGSPGLTSNTGCGCMRSVLPFTSFPSTLTLYVKRFAPTPLPRFVP